MTLRHLFPRTLVIALTIAILPSCSATKAPSKPVNADALAVLSYSNNIRVGDIVECASCAGNNVNQVVSVEPDGLATVKNLNNGGVGKIAVLNLERLDPPSSVRERCVKGHCIGDKVLITGAVGSGDRKVQVVNFFSNDTVNVKGISSGEVSTYRIGRLQKPEETVPNPTPVPPKVSMQLESTCIGPTANYTNCEMYCSYIGKKCVSICSSPAGRLNQAASAWPRGSSCAGLDAGGDVSCSFKFDDQLNAVPRWRCCCR